MEKMNFEPGGITWVDEANYPGIYHRWSPFDIHLMLHFYATPTERFEWASAPIYQERVTALMDAKLIEADGGAATHVATDLGRALVEMWCRQPIPVMTYRDPRFAD